VGNWTLEFVLLKINCGIFACRTFSDPSVTVNVSNWVAGTPEADRKMDVAL
jgi:hypothetical protein